MGSVDGAGAAPQFSIAYRRWMLFLLVAIYSCSFLDRVIINTVGPAIIHELHLSDLEFGLLGGAAFALFYTAFGMPIAWLAERSHRVTIISLCIGLWSTMTALSGVTTTYWQLLLFRMGVGIGEGGASPAAHSLLSDYYPPRQRASALAIYSAGIPIGVLLGAAGGGWVAQTFNWRVAFVVVGLPGLVLAILARLTLREPARGHSEAAPVETKAPPMSAVVKRLFATKTFRNIAAGFVLTNLAANGVNTFMSIYLVRSFHLGLAKAGLFYGLVVGVSGLIGTLVGGFGADAAGKRDFRWYAWAPALGSLVAMPIYVMAFTRPSASSAVALFFAGGLMVTLYIAPTLAVVQNLVEPRMRATAAAFMFLMINIFGQGVGPTVIGAASDFLSHKVFVAGGPLSLCPAAKGDPGFLAGACAAPTAEGLKWSLLALTISYFLGSLYFFAAARTIRKDLVYAAPSTAS